MIGRTHRRILALALGGIAVACSLALWIFKSPGDRSQLWKVPRANTRLGPALRLDQYHVVLEGVAIPGIPENLSGLTYNAERHTLFGVLNKPASLAEISLDGRLLGLSRLRGFEDTEGVTFLGNNRFAVVEEYKHSIRTFSTDQLGRVVPHSQGPAFVVGGFPRNNTGLEGIGFDYDDSLYVVKEILPMACYRVQGLVGASGFLSNATTVARLPFEAASLGLEDLAGIECDYGTGNLLLLSQKSKRAVEVTTAGEVVSTMSLVEAEHGLKHTVLQPEGIATDRNGRLYIVSEPNLLYVFAKKPAGIPNSLRTPPFQAMADPESSSAFPRHPYF